MTPEERVEMLHRSNVPSSVIARRTGLPRAEVNRVIREYERRRGASGVSGR